MPSTPRNKKEAIIMPRKLVIIALALLATALAGCSATTLDHARIGTATVQQHDEAINNLYRDGNFYFAGQPSQEGYIELASKGITKVINLRTAAEYEDFPFDEPAHVETLGMEYVNIPFTRDSFSDAHVEQFANELANTTGKVLIHCGSSNRVGLLWASYLKEYRGFSAHEAFAKGKAAGMTREPYFEAATSRLNSD